MRYLAFLFVALSLPVQSGSLTAQEYPYFTVESEPYVALQGGNNLVNSTWDDPEFVVPFGFDFTFFNRTINGAALSNSFSIISLADNLLSNVTSLFIVYGADLIDRGYLDNQHLSPIRYATTGNVGERVCTVEWENAGFLGDLLSNGTSTDFIHFQMKLYEASGDIVFHFGPNNIEYPELDFGVLPGPVTGIAEDYDIESDIVLGEVVLLSGNPSNPEVHTDYSNYALAGVIPENTLYRFSRELTSSVQPDPVLKAQLYFPNPAAHALYLKEWTPDDPVREVSIYDASGRKVLTTRDVGMISLEAIAPGAYTLRIDGESAAYAQNVIVLPD